MASIKYSGIISELKGSIAGTTFQSCRSGFIARAKPIPRNPRSRTQSTRRAAVSKVSQSWRTLSDAERISWASVAPNWPAVDKFGDPVTLSAYDVFMRCNTNLILANSMPLATGVNPAVLWPFTAPTMTISLGANTATWTWSGGAIALDNVAMLKMSRLLSPGRAYQPTGLKFIAKADAGVTSPQAVMSSVVAMLGRVPTLGARLWFEMIVYSTTNGNASAPFPFTCIVLA